MNEMYPDGLARTGRHFAQYARCLDSCLEQLERTAAELDSMSGQEEFAACVRRLCGALPARAEELRRLGGVAEQITAEVQRVEEQLCLRSMLLPASFSLYARTLPLVLSSTELSAGELDELGVNFE